MYLVTCKCGKTQKNFKFNIGSSFRGECCKEEQKPVVRSLEEEIEVEEYLNSSASVDPMEDVEAFDFLGDLNGDGVVDEKDAAIMLEEISKPTKKKKKKKK